MSGRTPRTTILDGDKVASIGDYTILAPYHADIRELDLITIIHDRRGDIYLSGGRMRVLRVLPRRGWNRKQLQFKQCMLETAGSVIEETGNFEPFVPTPAAGVYWGDAALYWGDTEIVWGGNQ